MADPLEQRLLEELQRGARQLRKDLGYNPSYFLRMVADLGPREACRRLVRAKHEAEGFETLWAGGRLDMSVEALVLLPTYADLFDDEDRLAARRRLERYGFDVDAFLDSQPRKR